MKITSCSITIEVSRDENGYSNNYYVDIDEKGVSVSHPYLKQSHEQVTLVNELINQFIDDFNHLNYRVDAFNRDMGLEQYAPRPILDTETTAESLAESAESQSLRGGSDPTDLVAYSEQEQERLDMEARGARETDSDMS